MFSKTCEHAIRALLFIAKGATNNKRFSIKEIAEEIKAPISFIAKILHELSKQGFVQSVKGPGGGFYMNESSLNNSLSDIVIAIDGDKIFNGCGLGLAYCSEDKPCAIHFEFTKIRGEIFEMLKNTRLINMQEQYLSRPFFLNKG
ncbi:MAG: Rrf2 family transcriptional regulator [Ferruginibacter sp.]